MVATPNEAERLGELYRYGILDTPADAAFDQLARIAAAICDTPIALFSLVDRHRQWFKARVGIDADETPRDISFCAHAVARGEILVVEDATRDARFADNPLVVAVPNVRFYAGVPVRSPERHCLGTLCVIDLVPRKLTTFQRETLVALAQQVEAQLELRRAHRELDRVGRERGTLVAMVVHDIRNPLTAIALGTQRLVRAKLLAGDDQAQLEEIVAAVDRIQRLTTNLLEASRGEYARLVSRPVQVEIERVIAQLEQELRGPVERSGHRLAVLSAADATGALDVELFRRVVDNLVTNACKFAPAQTEVRLETRWLRRGALDVRVCDEGPGIAQEDRERVFDPYFRLAGADAGFGLGLAFCRRACEAMGGRVWIEAGAPMGTVFRLELPIAPAWTA